jgi:hypothetical protein
MEIIYPGRPGENAGIESFNALVLVAMSKADRDELRGLAITLLRTDVPPLAAQEFLWTQVLEYGDRARAEWSVISAKTTDEEFDTTLAKHAGHAPHKDIYGAAVALAIALKLREEQEAASERGSTVLKLEKDVDLLPFFAVARPRRTGTAFAEIKLTDHTASIFALHPGSSIARILLSGGFTCAKYAAALFASSRSPDAAARHMMNEMRLLRENAGAYPLMRLDDPTAKTALAHAKAVIVFLHGLMSTDLGTFDGFINRWLNPRLTSLPAMASMQLSARELPPQALQAIKDSVPLVGWPHDTLTKIDVNAQDLVDLIDDLLGTVDCPIAFVCHSRGGLLARATAQMLYDKNDVWKKKICCAITFGTPHEGADFAEHPMAGIGTYLLAAQGAGLVPGVMDALAYIKQRGVVDGIRDLRPRSAPNPNFLQELRQRESAAVPHGQRRLPIITIAGNYQPAAQSTLRSIAQSYINTYTGQEANDLVVTVPSASAAHIADDSLPAQTANCDHFTYFANAESDMPHIDTVIGRLWDCFNLTSIVGPLLKERAPVGAIEVQEKTVTIGGITLPRN